MVTTYKLRCPNCSQDVFVTPTQAGEQATCSCGNTVKIPRLLELRKLPTQSIEQESGKRIEWNPIQGAFFAIGLGMIAMSAYIHFKIEPQRAELVIERPEFPEMEFDMQSLQPFQAWVLWLRYRDIDLSYRRSPLYLENRLQHQKLSRYLYLAWGGAGVGLCLVLVALTVSFVKRKPHRK